MKALKALAIFVTYVVAVLAGVMIGLTTTNDPQPAGVVHALPQPTQMSLPVCPTEDDPGPCVWFGGGNRDGMTFVSLPENPQPVTADMAATLGDEYGQPDRDWSNCRLYPGVTSYVVCPDGFFALS